MAATEETPATVVLVVRGTIGRAEIARLCDRARTLVERSGADLLVCDVGDLVTHDVCALDALARLALTVRRLGGRVGLRGAGPDLLDLVALAGLDDVLPVEPGRPAPDGLADVAEPCDPPL